MCALFRETSSGRFFYPRIFAAAALRVEVEAEDRRGWFEPLRWTTNEWGRWMNREFHGSTVKEAEITLETEGDSVRASLKRHGALLHRLETHKTNEALDDAGHPPQLPTFVYDYRLDSDWRRGLLGMRGVRLWQVPSQGHGLDSGESGNGTEIHRCDVDGAVFEWPTASASDPLVEFPVKELRSITFEERSSGTEALVAKPPRPIFVTKVQKAAFEASRSDPVRQTHRRR